AFSFGAGAFRAHFPYDTLVQWSGAGTMKIADDLVVAGASSVLNGATTVAVPYSQDCVDCGSGTNDIATPAITPAGGLFSFTPDGGLMASGPTTATVDLKWGYITSLPDFAQQAFAFTNGVFHMPGVFLRGDENLLPGEQGPTTILYTGFAGTNLNYAERPLSAGYSAGFADYAGLNFRCDADNAHAARSTIANQPNINWKLTGRSKYYVRYAGVTGIHEGVPGSFPASLTLWGYPFTFSNYGVSYLDSRNKDSLTDGQIALPYPSDFTQGFDNLKFSCLGAPVSGDVPPGDGFKVMAYWTADFRTHSITFKNNNGCSPTAGYLVLGVEGYASHVNQPLYGQIGFFPGGDQIPASFGLSNVTSRLKLPNVITVDGPSNTTYTFTPAQDGYYNTWSNRDLASPAPGWVNILGKMGVPFFDDLQLHLQTSCHTNGVIASNAVIYLSGGWPRTGSSDTDYGWDDASGRTPFETNFFDSANAGWPGSGGGLTIDTYRDNAGAQNYHPRAQRLWLGVVDFDYPLEWNSSLRSFKSWAPVTNNLLIVTIQHQVTYLDPVHAELDFGAQYAGLPQISIANLAFNAIDQATGIGDAIVKAASQPIEDALSTGLDQMNQLLDTQMKQLMDGVFDKTVDPVIDQFYNSLSNQWANNWNSLSLSQRQQFVQSVYTNGLGFFLGTGPDAISGNLTEVLTQLGSGVNSANDLIGQIQGYLRDGTNAINAIIGVVSIGTNGQNLGSNVVGLITQQLDGSRDGVVKLASSLIGDFAPQLVSATVSPTLSNLVAQAEPSLQELQQSLADTEGVLIEVSTQLDAAGQFTAQISNILASAAAEMTNVSLQVSLSATQYFGQLNYSIDNPFQAVSADDVKQFLRQKVEDQFFASDAASQIQTADREWLYDLDATMRQQMDSVFQQVNDLMRNLLSQSLAQLDNSISQCLGSVSNVMGAASLQGHADIDGDSLKDLRIDGHFQFKVPDNMDLDAFLEIKELDSDGSANGCGDTNAPFTEVTLGADGVPLNWISSGLTADVEAKFTFDGVVPFPIDLGGQLALKGTVDFQTFKLHDLAVGMAFGATENYIALKGGVKFNGFDFSGAAFFGRTCTLDPLKLIDPDVAKVIGNPPFTGGYLYAQGWLPISQLYTGIPASCLFEISAGVGAGAFYFAEGPTYGGKMFLGVSGQLLCIVSIEGDVTMIGVDHGGNVQFLGKGHFAASLGPCPFCIQVSKDVSISYLNNSWNIQ
ncbi:MAG: methyl-accepting chemotaxis protein, partial [Verrucomicrobiota bacterium]|nr:methyl-accepting chemotaxis protein [Verrucomicrobiota bacterium]